jgi:predicted TIM-barrel fold metal-dependent hydrolase
LEDVLMRHPKLRLYVMHAGWPMSHQMVALLYAHPQVYVDVAVIDWAIPRREFHQYLRRLVEAGFGKRIMFGSDQMVWPGQLTSRSRGFVPQTSSRKNRNETSFITTQPASCDGMRANSSHRSR